MDPLMLSGVACVAASSTGMDEFEKKVMQKLKGPLRAKLAHTIYGSLLKDAPFLKWMREFPTCIMELSLHCTTV